MIYTFISKSRSADFEDLPGVMFRNYEYRTEDEAIAEKLRKKKDVSELNTSRKVPKAAPVVEVAKAEEAVVKPEAIAEGAPAIRSGMRTSPERTPKKEKYKK